MNKLAIFVEGQTEQIFAERLLREIAGDKRILIEKRSSRGGHRGKRRMTLLEAAAKDSARRFFVLIVDCGGDEHVKSDIMDRYTGLVQAGFQAIIGIRDVYPRSREDIPKLRQGLRYQMPTLPIHVVFVLAVMEIEAWFLAEHTHFVRLSPTLTTDCIRKNMGFDPDTDDMRLRDHPADDLHAIYQLAGCGYDKSKKTVQRTVGLIDYERVYIELAPKEPDLSVLTAQIDRFLTRE